MDFPIYVSAEEVKLVCATLGIRNWNALQKFEVSLDEAEAILAVVQGEAKLIPIDDFRDGLQVELEHGVQFPDANVTNNHPILTGRIVLAHLKESLLYYKFITVMELEGDILKAAKLSDGKKLRELYQRLSKARILLYEAEDMDLK
jgi:hypothetical protein